MIKDLAEKIRVLEENTHGKEDTINENEESESEMDNTFLNPYLVKKCDTCDFVTKTPGGLHMRAKHKEVQNNNGPEISWKNIFWKIQLNVISVISRLKMKKI